jgi:hypothetical protein
MRYGRWLRCSWCEAEAVIGRGSQSYLLPACEAHREESCAACLAVQTLRPPQGSVAYSSEHSMETHALKGRVLARDEAEQRGEALDWSRPVEGWKLL